MNPPSLHPGGTAPGLRATRLLQAVQAWKQHVGSAGAAPDCADGVRRAAMDLFARLDRLGLAVARAGNDDALTAIETDGARALAHEVRLFARRSHILLARPLWPDAGSGAEANAVFFSGEASLRAQLVAAVKRLGLTVLPDADADAKAGADVGAGRWAALRRANLAVFDLAEPTPQVCYELGMALTLGGPVLLLGPAGSDTRLDIGEPVRRRPRQDDLRSWLADQVQASLVGLRAPDERSDTLAATSAHAARLAASGAGDGGPMRSLSMLMLPLLQAATHDAVQFHDTLATFSRLMGPTGHVLLQTRWPGHYPDSAPARCFVVMPARAARDPLYAGIASVCDGHGIEPERSVTASGVTVVASMWDALCRAAHVVVDLSGFDDTACVALGIADTLGRPTLLMGEPGTAQQLAARLPGVARQRRVLHASPPASTDVERALHGFLQPG